MPAGNTSGSTRGKYKQYTKQEGVTYGRPLGSYQWGEDELLELGRQLIEWFEADPDNLFFIQFFHSKGLYKDFLTLHRDKYESFDLIIKNAKQMQEAKLVQRVVTSRYNPAGGIFVLKNWHGFTDKVEHDYGKLNAPTQIIINLPESVGKLNLPEPTDATYIDITPSKIPLQADGNRPTDEGKIPPATGSTNS